jgi:hypothetical protein
LRFSGPTAACNVGREFQVSYYTFRHTFGTLLNANGESPRDGGPRPPDQALQAGRHQMQTIGQGKSDKVAEGGIVEILVYPEGTTTAQVRNSASPKQ